MNLHLSAVFLKVKRLSQHVKLIKLTLHITLISVMVMFPILEKALSEAQETRYYLSSQRGDWPFTQYLLKPGPPSSTDPVKVAHPNNFIWRTDFQPSELTFGAGWWSLILWLESNESTTCMISLGIFNGFTGYNHINIATFPLNQTSLKQHVFTIDETPAFTVLEGECLAFQLNASSANLYVDSAETPSYVQFSTQPPSITTQTVTTTETQSPTTSIQTLTQTTENTFTSQIETRTLESSSTTFTTETLWTETPPYITSPSITPGRFTLMVHAHTEEFQYPSEPPHELSVFVLVERSLNGVKRVEVKETPFIVEIDGGTVANLTVIYFEPGLTWVEWDNYGVGRTNDSRVSILMNSNRNAVAYFSPEAFQSATSTEEQSVIIVIPGYSNMSILLGLLAAVSIITMRGSRRSSI